MSKDFSLTFRVDQTPQQVFKAVTDVRGWWQGLFDEEILGESNNLNDEFTFRAGGGAHYSKQRLIEIVPDQKVVWLVTEGELSFVENKDEWQGTKIIFEITRNGNKTDVKFTHKGLNPQVECYDSCSSAWQLYLNQKFLSIVQS